MTTKPAVDAPGVIAFPPLLLLATVATGVAAHLLSPVPLPVAWAWRLAGVLSGAAGLAIVLWARAQMVRAGTNVRPDKPSTAIVTTGPYRFTRNPMYLSLCLLNLGIAFGIGDLVPALLTLPLAVVLHVGVILREERYLRGKFGETYSAYCRQVRRWL